MAVGSRIGPTAWPPPPAPGEAAPRILVVNRGFPDVTKPPKPQSI